MSLESERERERKREKEIHKDMHHVFNDFTDLNDEHKHCPC